MTKTTIRHFHASALRNIQSYNVSTSRLIIINLIQMRFVIYLWTLCYRLWYYIIQHFKMSSSGEFGNPLRKFKLVFLGEQSGKLTCQYTCQTHPATSHIEAGLALGVPLHNVQILILENIRINWQIFSQILYW